MAVLVATLCVFGCNRPTNDRAEPRPEESAGVSDPFAGLRQASVLLLGTFHFDDPKLDSY